MITEGEFIQKLKKESFFEHTGAQKEVLWGRLLTYIESRETVGFWHFSFRIIYLVAVVLIVLLASTGVTFASQKSLPGQPLYPVKRLSEEARIFVIFGEKEKKKERIKLTTRRAAEVNKLAEQDLEKAEQVLEEYETQMAGLEDESSEDPELSESYNSVLLINREVFIKVVQSESAPEQIKTRIKMLIGEPEESTEEKDGNVEGEQDTVDLKEESMDPPAQKPNSLTP